MRALVQRVTKAKVKIGSNEREISKGLVVLLAIAATDTQEKAKLLSEKVLNLRIFPNDLGKFDNSVLDIKGEILVVSQFTLYGDCTRGRRPDFRKSASPVLAKKLYEDFVEYIIFSGLKTATGEFQESMLVEIHNDGPVTLIVDAD